MKRRHFFQDKERILNKNSKIDRKLIDKAEYLEKQLAELGVSTKPQYTLSHPLNSSPIFLFNQ